VRRILHEDLNYHPNKIQMVHKLAGSDFASRNQFCTQSLALVNENPDIVKTLIMLDESHFELSGHVNKQNMRYWSETNRQQLHEGPLHSARVTAWCGISASRIIGPYFLKENHGNTITVDLERYAKLLTNFLIPELHRFGVDLTRAHTARETLSTLRTVFPDKLSRYRDIPWSARSPDLT
jgi:hypothetical protein